MWVGTASSRGREAVVGAARPPSRNRRSAVPRIAADQASDGGRTERRLNAGYREYARRRRPAPHAAQAPRSRKPRTAAMGRREQPFDPARRQSVVPRSARRRGGARCRSPQRASASIRQRRGLRRRPISTEQCGAPHYDCGGRNSRPVSSNPTKPTWIWFAVLAAKPASQSPWNDSVLSALVAASRIA